MIEQPDICDIETIDAFTCIGLQPEDDRDLGTDILLAQMSVEGIGYALCCSFNAIRYDSEIGNRELLTTCLLNPHLLPVAVINPAPFYNIDTLITLYKQLGFLGLRFVPYRQGWSLDCEPFHRAVYLYSELGLPISVELGASGDATKLSHLAGGLEIPVILANVTYATLGEAMAVLEAHENLYLEASRLVSPGIVEILVARLGAERLLFASGAPAWQIAPSLEIIRQADINASAKTAILGGNARRVYHLDSREVGI
jgi:predicted TIM-barrel fold metal-dependent hydrolase